LKGGISPKAGNGVIIYSPDEKRYFLYFHLYDALVEKGQIVRRGQAIGHGGNTGINARKKGGGDHLHFEIFDAQRVSRSETPRSLPFFRTRREIMPPSPSPFHQNDFSAIVCP